MGASRSQRVSPVWASLSFTSTTNSPGPASATSADWAPSVRKKCGHALLGRVRGFISVVSGLSVPEKMRT